MLTEAAHRSPKTEAVTYECRNCSRRKNQKVAERRSARDLRSERYGEFTESFGCPSAFPGQGQAEVTASRSPRKRQAIRLLERFVGHGDAKDPSAVPGIGLVVDGGESCELGR
jgi:hypothetical protein